MMEIKSHFLGKTKCHKFIMNNAVPSLPDSFLF